MAKDSRIIVPSAGGLYVPQYLRKQRGAWNISLTGPPVPHVRIPGTGSLGVAGAAPQISQSNAGQADFTPRGLGLFTTGTNGQPCNAEFDDYGADNNPIIYTNEVTGPFGETKVGKVQLLDYLSAPNKINGYFYGGYPKVSSPISCNIGDELWGRIYMRFPTTYCFSGMGTGGGYPENVNGSLKYFRVFFDGSNRCTLLLGSNENSSIWMNQGSCGSTSTTPVIGACNSEVTSTNFAASPLIVLTRDTWFAIQWYIKFNTSNGIFRAWVNGTRILNATNAVTRPTGAQYTTCSFAMPGDYYNGGPLNYGMFAYVANFIIATNASPPSTKDGQAISGDSQGAIFIPHTLSAFDF